MKKKKCKACNSTKDRRRMWYQILTEELRNGSCAIIVTRRDTMKITAQQEKKGYSSTAVELKKEMEKTNEKSTEKQGSRCTWTGPKITVTMNQ